MAVVCSTVHQVEVVFALYALLSMVISLGYDVVTYILFSSRLHRHGLPELLKSLSYCRICRPSRVAFQGSASDHYL
jgi:hypothetical protein